MRYGIFAATLNGAALAERVQTAIASLSSNKGEQIEVFIHYKVWQTAMSARSKWQQYNRLSEIVPDCFARFDALLFIMATGIVVRSIAPCLVSKLSDPAVLVMDERAKHIISLISGHVGGANRLAGELAIELHAEPVITTATDVNGLIAPDVLANELMAVPVQKDNLVVFNGALLSGKKLHYKLSINLKCLDMYERLLQRRNISYEVVDDTMTPAVAQYAQHKNELFVLLTDEADELPRKENWLYLKPRKLIAGVGCRRGTDERLVLTALENACSDIGWATERIAALASTVVKSDEQGLLMAAEHLGVQIHFFANEQLSEKIQTYSLQESAFVKKTIGVGNVCEAAALCCVEKGRIAIPKTKYEKVTVALIWEK